MLFNLDVKNIVVLIAALVNIIFGLIVYSRGRDNKTNLSFFLLTIAVSFWGVSMFMYRATYDVNQALFFSRILYVAASTIPITFLYFVFIFPESNFNASWWQKYILPIPFLISCAISLSPSFLIESVQFVFRQENIIVFNVYWHAFYAVYIIFYFSWGYMLLFNKYRHSEGFLRKQILYIIIGTLVSTMIGVFTNLILLLFFNIYSLNWFGQVGIVVMIVSISYAVLKHHLFNVRVITAEVFTFSIWIFILVRALTAEGIQEKLIEGGLLLLTIVIGIFLIKSVLKEVRQREEIEKLAEELQAANKRQENLLHFINHEVKGYLTADAGAFAGILEGDYGEIPAPMKEMVESALKHDRMGVDMVMEMLTSSNIKSGKIQFASETFDLKPELLKLIDQVKGEASTRGLTLETKINDGESYTIAGDKEKIVQHVLKNLIMNAILYTPKGGIVAGLSKYQGKIIFSVKDSGVGISAEDMEHLFSEGGKGKDSIKVNAHSTGYGLFISKQIVDAHQGRIWAQSKGPGQGSTFFVEFAAK